LLEIHFSNSKKSKELIFDSVKKHIDVQEVPVPTGLKFDSNSLNHENTGNNRHDTRTIKDVNCNR
jgi:hypothetical protein